MSTAETFPEWMRKLAKVSPPCQMGRHEICDELTAKFVAGHPEFGPYNCHCNCHIDRYIAERDRARSVAAALEQELALKDEAIEQLRAQHRPFGIYEECSHCHTDEDVAVGVAKQIAEVGLVCADGLMYRVCYECCTGGSGYQSEECVDHHDHSAGTCNTARVLDSLAARIEAAGKDYDEKEQEQ